MEVLHLHPDEYRKWMRRIPARDAAAIMRRLSLLGEFGVAVGLPNVRRINNVIWEIRIPTGLRIYFTVDGEYAVVVKYGNKDSQRLDIASASRRAQELRQ